MIFKVMSNLIDNEDLFNKLNQNFDFLLLNNTLYLSCKNMSLSLSQCRKKILQVIGDNAYLNEITENNLKFENIYCIEWCKKHFIEYDKRKFEIENQQKLQKTMRSLDLLEMELEKKGVNN